MNQLLVTRHAPYDVHPQTGRDYITEQGLEVCNRKVSELLARGIGHDAILLSSVNRRAVLTTGELRRPLGIRESFRSPYITAVGTRPEPVQNLHDFTTRVLAGCGIEAKGRDVLLIVHKPLVDAVDSRAGDSVIEVPDNWINPKFEPDFEFMTEEGEQNLRMWLR